MEPEIPLLQAPVSPPAGPPWQRTVYTVALAQLVSIIGFWFVLPFMPFYIRELGVTDEGQVAIWAGVTMTASGLMFAVFSPVWGVLADRYGRKIMVERAMFSGAVIIALMGAVHNVYQLVGLRMLQGALTGTVVACTTLVSSIVPRDQIGRSLGIQQMAVVAGSSLGPWLGGMMAAHWGYRIPFFAAGALLLLGGIITLVGAYEDFTPPSKDSTPENHGMREAFGGKGLFAVLAVFFFLALSLGFVGPIFPLFVEEIASKSTAAMVTGQLMMVTGIGAGIGSLLIGPLGDRFGHKSLLTASVLLGGIVIALHAVVKVITALFGLRVVTGLATGGITVAINALIATVVSRDTYGRAYGVTQTARALGWAIGPLVGGVLASAIGLRWPFVVTGGMLAISAGLIALLVRMPRETG